MPTVSCSVPHTSETNVLHVTVMAFSNPSRNLKSNDSGYQKVTCTILCGSDSYLFLNDATLFLVERKPHAAPCIVQPADIGLLRALPCPGRHR